MRPWWSTVILLCGEGIVHHKIKNRHTRGVPGMGRRMEWGEGCNSFISMTLSLEPRKGVSNGKGCRTEVIMSYLREVEMSYLG